MPNQDRSTAVSDMFSSATRLVVMLVFDGVEAIDVAGPCSVFSQAAACVPGAYAVCLVSPLGGKVSSNSGFSLADTQSMNGVAQTIDTLLVCGGDEAALRAAILEQGVAQWIACRAPNARRIASVCTGAFALAAAGLLKDKRATTHWNACGWLQELSPATRVLNDRVYVQDGNVWTSAGVTTGIDLALALVEADLGRPLALRIAKNLALPYLRSGRDAQLTPSLAAQADVGPRLRDLLPWVEGHLTEDLRVEDLAQRVNMSPRNFSRAFRAQTGHTPAQFVAQARLGQALRLREQTDWPQEKIAQVSGYRSVDALQRAFARHKDASS